MPTNDQTEATKVTIQVLLQENRKFPPPAGFAAQANIRDPGVYEAAARDREEFWANFAEELHWFKRWDQVLEWDPPIAKWFVGGKINVAYNCLDRHLTAGRQDKAALIWEGEPGDSKVYTYGDLHREVCRLANGLKSLGVRKGDMVALYLPNLPELPIAMLACARIGAAHNAVFSGFDPEALGDRIKESRPKVLITCDGSYRGGVVSPLKNKVDEALASTPALGEALDKVVVVRRTGAADDLMQPGRDIWWDDLTSGQSLQCDSEPMDSEDTLYWLYTSGTTGRPKGVIHTTAGYLLGTYATAKWVFDLKDHDIHWCTADVGGVTGHSYTVYGPLANGATTVMYEGTPDYPERDRFWSIVEKYSVTVLYTHPTVIRSFIRWGEEHPARHNLSSLRLLGTVGEPINPEAWMWYWENIGGSRCPVVNTWWQTETGMIMIAPLPGITTLKPGSPTRPFPGVDARVVDSAGKPVAPGEGGHLVINGPWPAMLRPASQDTIPIKERYWFNHPNFYYPGDGSKIDQDGYIWMLGRVVDLIHTPAHSLSNAELESALVNHRVVAEAACIGVNQSEDDHSIVAFVTLKETVQPSQSLGEELKRHVEMELGSTARPDHVLFAAELPKTLSGKIMRRLLVEIVEGRDIGDVTSLADFSVVEALKSQFGPRQPSSLSRVY